MKRSGSSSGGDKRDHKLSVSADTPRDKNSFLQRGRSNSGDHTIKRSGSGNGDNNTTSVLLSSSPVAVARQYKTSSSPGLSPNITRQNKIFLSSAKIRPPKLFNKDGA
jgi:stress response protein SCP2